MYGTFSTTVRFLLVFTYLQSPWPLNPAPVVSTVNIYTRTTLSVMWAQLSGLEPQAPPVYLMPSSLQMLSLLGGLGLCGNQLATHSWISRQQKGISAFEQCHILPSSCMQAMWSLWRWLHIKVLKGLFYPLLCLITVLCKCTVNNQAVLTPLPTFWGNLVRIN